MFYSQFILAKKGPLGIIWIAAHLERKLRKNQVADTDIGVSVDSILFPEVPIALRLSSHLLLGVVRIYSRKVNYLFDDCSEALLKIKQAFRSTAVDLPPEESTAPYHSITLPETFDLDDFELPDNDFFQCNHVDHHISTREQITLQDTMEGVVYSTSQFGLDERFGDGDTLQAGFDLEEDLLLDKGAAYVPGEIAKAGPQASSKPTALTKGDAVHDRMTGSSEAVPVNDTRNKIEGLVANSQFIDYAHAPSIPGLIEESNSSSGKDSLASDDHLESEDHSLVGKGNASTRSDLQKRDSAMNFSLSDHLSSDVNAYMPVEENGCIYRGLESSQAKSQGDLPSSAATITEAASQDGPNNLEINKGVLMKDEPCMPCICEVNAKREEAIGVMSNETSGVEFTNNMEELPSSDKGVASIPVHLLELAMDPEHVNVEAQACDAPEDTIILNNHANDEQIESDCAGVLQACNSCISQNDPLMLGVCNDVLPPDLQLAGLPSSSETSRRKEKLHASGASGEECHLTDDIRSEGNQILGPTFHKEIQDNGANPDGQLINATSIDNLSENANNTVISDFPAPEKLLSILLTHLDKPDDLLAVLTPDRDILEGGDVSDAETRISGKKRSFTESSLTIQSLNSVESSGVTRSKRISDSIPDDDDLLSSILVGRSSVLKMKPTPPAPEVASTKRPRSASRPSTLKRKVLMDDFMVLHGDTIRQQLTSTEDIRRLRKKAPCTCTEILTIQRQFLQEGIFSEPVLTSMAAALTCLHGESFDLSGIRISENDDNNVSLEVANDRECSVRPIVGQDGEIEGNTEPTISRNNIDGQPTDKLSQDDNTGDQVSMDTYDVVADCRTSEHEPLRETKEVDIGRGNTGVGGAANRCGDGESTCAYKTTDVDASLLVSLDTQPVQGLLASDMNNGKGLDSVVLDLHTDNRAAVVTELKAVEELSLEESKVALSDEIRADIEVDDSVLTGKADASLVNCSSEADGCVNVTCKEGRDVAVTSECDNKDKKSCYSCNEESKADPTYLVGVDGEFKNASLYNGGYPVCQDQQCTMDTDITSFDHHAVGVSSGFEYDTFANDTGFLNVDDDVGEEDDDGMPCAEDTSLLENSGWSSRTRAVAKYLQTLFDKESGHGRKALSMNNLLAGKTRKEVSRMFFETLVLKSKDYVQVEQAIPFDNINIKPRSKLVKSDF